MDQMLQRLQYLKFIIFISLFLYFINNSLGFDELDVQKFLENGECKNCDLTDADFSGARLVLGVDKITIYDDGNEEVSGFFLTAENIFSFERYSIAIFTGGDLTNADFSNNILMLIQFDNVNAENADFSDSDLIYTKLQNANLKNANFQNSYLYKTNFTNADLSGADFSGAEILDNVIFNGAILDCINHPICN